MKILRAVVVSMLCMAPAIGDELSDASQLYSVAQMACSGIADEIGRISEVSTANAVVGGVGTVAAGGALAAGIAKQNVDAEIERLVEKMCAMGGCNEGSIEQMSYEDFLANVLVPMAEIALLVEQKTQQSKRLGNWRTGLMGGTIATNVASAILAGVNSDQSELIQQIQACNAAVVALVPYKKRLIAAGVNPIQEPIVNKIDDVATWCQPIDVADVEKIERRMTAVMGVSIGGAAVGVAGTATSAAAKQKEKSLNTAANVLAGVNVAAGVTEVGLNISLISLSKNLIKQAEMCQGAF